MSSYQRCSNLFNEMCEEGPPSIVGGIALDNLFLETWLSDYGGEWGVFDNAHSFTVTADHAPLKWTTPNSSTDMDRKESDSTRNEAAPQTLSPHSFPPKKTIPTKRTR